MKRSLFLIAPLFLFFVYSAYAAKLQRALGVQIQCENVASGSTNAITASMVIGTSDDAIMIRSAELTSLTLTTQQANQLTNLCNQVATAIKNANNVP